MIALFRIQEVADGTMFIDGVNTKTVPLRTLRSRIGIIPQGRYYIRLITQFQYLLSTSTRY